MDLMNLKVDMVIDMVGRMGLSLQAKDPWDQCHVVNVDRHLSSGSQVYLLANLRSIISP